MVYKAGWKSNHSHVNILSEIAYYLAVVLQLDYVVSTVGNTSVLHGD